MSDATMVAAKAVEQPTPEKTKEQIKAAEAQKKMAESVAQRQAAVQQMNGEIEYGKRQTIISLINLASSVLHPLMDNDKKHSEPSISAKLKLAAQLLDAAKTAGDILKPAGMSMPMGRPGMM